MLDIYDGIANDKEEAEDGAEALQQTLIIRDKAPKNKPQIVKYLHHASPEEYHEYVPLREQQDEETKFPTCSFICAVANPPEE